jgi:hypothetical protein
MKKIFFVALGATLLAASCQKTEIINPVGDKISFSSEMGKLTKAEGTGDLTTLKAQDFSVWAYYVTDDKNTAGDDTHKVYDKIANVKVTDDQNGKWTTTEQYYWPGVGKELIFFAVSADEATIGSTTFDADGEVATNTSKVDINADRNALTIKDFTVNPASPNVDLMVADIVQQHQGDKVVDLNFHHTLAKVEFMFQTITNEDNLTVTVNSLTVAGIKTVGTFSTTQPVQTKADDATGDDTTGDDTTGNENEPENPGTTTPAYSGTQTEVGFYWGGQTTPEVFSVKKADAPAPFVLDDDYQTYSSWLVIPQDISTSTVTVNYTIGEKTFDSIFNLYTTGQNPLTEWKPNQYVAYRITLAPNLITFSPSVEDWDDVDNRDMVN